MSKTVLILIGFFLCLQSFGQDKSRVFWQEDFSAGELPTDWIIKALNDSNVVWDVTNQPFMGSYGHSQQAPPIASESGGFHLQFAPGIITDKYIRKWNAKGVYPDSYVQTSSIDCSSKKSVVLTFQQNFLWNNWANTSEKMGLFVCVSNNGKDWKEYDVRNKIGSEEDCSNPMNVELNITSIAALQKSVYIRFLWKGIFAWYWMVDDIKLSEALDLDLSASALISHSIENNIFTEKEVIKFEVVNLSAKEVKKPFDCYLQIDNRKPMKLTIPFGIKKPLGIVDTVQIAFPKLDLTDYGIHKIKFYCSIDGDNRRENDTLKYEIYSKAYKLGLVTGHTIKDNIFTFSCNNAKVQVEFCKNDIFRLQMSYNGEFTNPVGNDIVINKPNEDISVDFVDKDDYYLMKTTKIALRAYKKPLRFAMYKADNKTLVWEETSSMTYGKETIQYLKRGENEYFYGGGMQNGRFSHRDKTIQLKIDWNWEEGGAPNPAAFYMSTKGYGAMRNTYAPGAYSFTDTLNLMHEESRFDCYYFAGKSLKEILAAYTDITGKPFLPPRWGLNLGDANCYNRGENKGKNNTGYKGTTPDVIQLIADKYIENNMPRGWILPNDGYGCGYTKLDSVIDELRMRGFRTGLWTENGVKKIAREVGEYGSRICKLDVAWVGYGYKFAIDGCKAAYDGIEKNSNARGFIWSVCGWTGTHRNSVIWTGDQSGSWDYIRWHIPTVIGSGLSGQNCATGDVDGIFGGSAKTYTRDLQWKCFTPVFMSMSGWAPKDKQPYVYGEPYTSINRKYLMLKMRLTPYMYTLCNDAWETGVPAVRGLVLEYPNDPFVLGTKTKYQFLLGKNILVAPVYRDEEKRDSIYLPAGKWIDYWDGTIYKGNQILNNYSAPLDKLPLFIKAGSIIPMYPRMFYDGERPLDTLTLDIYPGQNVEFEMYEDDGSTQEYRQGKYSKTRMKAIFDEKNNTLKELNIYAGKGDYIGKLDYRTYILQIHSSRLPNEIKIQNVKLEKVKSKEAFIKSTRAWYFAHDDKKGIIYVKTDTYSTSEDVNINMD